MTNLHGAKVCECGVPDINPNRLRLGCGHMENCIVSLGYTQFNKPNLIFLNLSCVDPHTVFPFFYIFTLLTARELS